MTRPMMLVDVFSEESFGGNPLAVVFEADDLSTEQMLRITRWMNLSETAFLVRPTVPEADYRVRIFTLDREMPFAGHPTLGSCRAWLEHGGRPRGGDTIVQECGAGLVRIRRREPVLSFAAPPLIRSGPVDDAHLEEVAAVLRIERTAIVDAAWADNGPGWVLIWLQSADAVLALDPVRAHPERVDIGVVGPYPPGSASAFELRTFFSDHHRMIVEDPVTGSFNASAAQWLLATGRASAPWTASQGQRVGRAGRIAIDQDAEGTVWVGGHAVVLMDGHARNWGT